jgi:hypothetical protein
MNWQINRKGTLRFAVVRKTRKGMTTYNKIFKGGCNGEGSSQVVQRSKGLWVY